MWIVNIQEKKAGGGFMGLLLQISHPYSLGIDPTSMSVHLVLYPAALGGSKY